LSNKGIEDFYLGQIADIIHPLKNKVKALVTTDVARAIVEMNRARMIAERTGS
jgi:hypothetical protein